MRPHRMVTFVPLALLLVGATAAFAFTEVTQELKVPRLGWVEDEGLWIQPTETHSTTRSSPLSALVDQYGGNWRYNRNSITGSLHRAYGSGFQFTGPIRTEAGAAQAAMAFVAANPDIFGAAGDLETAEVRNGAGKWVVHFNQVVNDVRVVGGRAHVVFTESGRIFAMGADVYPNVLQSLSSTLPALSEAQALSIAGSDVRFQSASDIVTHNELVILPVREAEDEFFALDYRLAYRLDPYVHDPRSHWSTYVDARSGEILWRKSLIYTLDFTGHVQSDVEWDGYCDGYTFNFPVEEMIINIAQVGSTTTDVNGDFTLSYGGTDSKTITAEFVSQWLNVDRYTGTDAQHLGLITPGVPYTIDWSNTNSIDSERDCFAYLNYQHRWLKDLDPSFTGLDYEMPCVVERTDGYCPGNAWYDWYGVNFCAEGGGYGNTGRMGDVAYHEYGHGLTHEIYDPNDPSSGMHEGNSDVAALLLTREPRLGLGFHLDGCEAGIRNAENNMIYPDDWTDDHTGGQIISGFIWDTWQGLMEFFPWDYADSVIANDWHYSRTLGLPQTPPDQVYWTFVVDDDDGNLDNGTPHHAYICVGATNHGFDCPEIINPITILHTPVTEQTSTTDSTAITANITSSATPINESACQVYYRLDGGFFSNVGMSHVGGDDYTGYIPPQPAGTFVEYYIYGEDNDANSKTHPANAPADLHGFHVGEFVTIFEDDFETDQGWTVGDTGDDADTGIWERCDPEGTTAQAEDDHTPDPGVNAYITECDAGQNQGINDVDGGKTTLLSPLFDLSAYSNATLSYHRWYSNDTGSAPRSDYWVVEITDDGWTTWETLENTNLSDRSWTRIQFDLSSYVGRSDQVQLRFIASDEGLGSIVEAGVDDFLIQTLLASDTEPPAVTVVTPNGGEEIDALTEYTISWTSSDNEGVTATYVLLSTDSGASYPDTVASLADETSYQWTVPDINEPDCRIKVACYDAESNEGSDESDADFRIIPQDAEAPTVTVVAPNGGEEIDALTEYTISWTSSDNVGVTATYVLLSTDSGTSYPDTVASLTDETSYQWIVPNIDEPDCRIKVVCYDAASNEGSDDSDADFRIIWHDVEAPTVTVVAPNGGEEIYALTEYTISWTSTDNVGVTMTHVLLSTDSGATYPDTVASLTDETSYQWTVPDIDEPDCRIRVVCYDAESNEGSDESDADFRIIPHDGEAPVVAVVAPNGGEEIDALTEYTISWTSSDNVGVTATYVFLSTDSGSSYPDTVASLTDETSYQWTVPDIDEPDCRIKVVCYDAQSNEGSDESDADFRIIPHDDEAPLVTVVAPNGGEEIDALTEYTVSWTSSDNVGVTATYVLLSTDSGTSYPDTVASLVDETSYQWNVPNIDEPDCRIKVVCYDAESNEGSDESDANFRIIPYDDEAPMVTVVAPNGGEEVGALTEYTISWTSTDNVGVTATYVLLSTDSGTSYPDTVASLTDETSYQWTVPDIDEPDCRIKVVCYDAESNEGSDESDTDFRIIPYDDEAPLVTVATPNGGEEIDALTEYTISWTSSDNVGVTATYVLLSTDSGASYPDTVASLTDETSYQWTVPDIDEPDCRIRVVCYDAELNEGADESDADFRIIPHDGEAPTVTVVAPNGGEEIDALTEYTISWTSSDNVGVTATYVLLSTDSGTSYPDTVASLVDETSYQWNVPNIDESTCRIKVICYDAESNEGSDESDADFRIIPHDGEAPEVLVVDPNGGEVIEALSEYTIRWAWTDNVGVTTTHVLLSTDSGASYPDTIASLTNEISYQWAVPDMDEPDCRIKVVCYDAALNEGGDESDGDFSITGASDAEDRVEVPDHLVLSQSRPNPFNPATKIEFGLPTAQRITLSVYSVKGQLVEVLAQGEYPAGYHTVVWRGTNAQGLEVARGLYFYRLVTEDKILRQKMLLLR